MEIPKVPESIPTPAELVKSHIANLRWLNHISSAILLSVTATYSIGFLIVNSSLFKYGFVPYDFLQARYVSAGLLYLISTAGLSGIILTLVYFVKKYHSKDEGNAEISSAWVIVLVLMVLTSRAQWLFPKSENIPSWAEWISLFIFILAILIAAFGMRIIPFPQRLSNFRNWWEKHLWEGRLLSPIVFLLLLASEMASRGFAFGFYPLFVLGILLVIGPVSKQANVISEYANGIIYGIVFIGLSIYVYSTHTYPLISPHVGGGKPLLISLSIAPDAGGRSIGRIMGREDWKCVMHNISLIHENSESIYVLPHGYLIDESAIAIPKDRILSIAYQQKAKAENATCME